MTVEWQLLNKIKLLWFWGYHIPSALPCKMNLIVPNVRSKLVKTTPSFCIILNPHCWSYVDNVLYPTICFPIMTPSGQSFLLTLWKLNSQLVSKPDQSIIHTHTHKLQTKNTWFYCNRRYIFLTVNLAASTTKQKLIWKLSKRIPQMLFARRQRQKNESEPVALK